MIYITIKAMAWFALLWATGLAIVTLTIHLCY
ncbi:hypothetical protein PP141_gp11 [Pseudomonas phage 14-1]|uniref:Uncharacterized protein n=2 Tax=Pbunavirus pv141 TaxID=2006174 RepID=B7VG72_9CAUD|nr:hypothetical protein PP141_gp11 [Pseudomonas phage 14-1]QIQ66789.1 hypothetical protein jett_10 [Pseudomonas phage jett]CAU13829.1 hypothetical protein [Pseudomonas phage 14-1]